ncbi:MAG: SET domain-containing protein-lysine N-methyltransferase [bacterium]|nr:SET domain-containing protein-lysine N-methyltransferase [bacterium]
MKSAPGFFINPKTKVRKSDIEGKGLFAKEKIKKGEVIHVAEDNILTLEVFKTLPKEWQNICYSVGDNRWLCPKNFSALSADWYVNHSCDPNCGSALDWFTLIAMRDIEPNEEITYDYAMADSEPDWSMNCHCGIKDCREKITGDDWKIKGLQERYTGYFQENVQNKIDASRNHISFSRS